MQRIPSAGTAISRAAAAEIPSRMHRPDRALAALAALPMSMHPRTQTAIIIARLRSKTARILHSIKNLFRVRRLLHRRIPYNPPPKRWRAHSHKPRLLAPASSPTPRAKLLCRPAPDVRRAMWQRQRAMQHPRQEKQRPMRRIIVRILLSPSWAARSRRIRSRNRPYIPSRNPIRAAAIRRLVPQESRITAAMHRGRRFRPNPRSSAVPLCRLQTRQAHSQQQIIRLRLLLRDPVWQEIRLCRTAAHRQLPHKTARQENSPLPIRQMPPVPHRAAIAQELVRGRSNRVARRIRRRPVPQTGTQASPVSAASSERQSRKPAAPAAMGGMTASAPVSQESRGLQRSPAAESSAKRPVPQERKAGTQPEPQKKEQTLYHRPGTAGIAPTAVGAATDAAAQKPSAEKAAKKPFVPLTGRTPESIPSHLDLHEASQKTTKRPKKNTQEVASDE